MKKLGLIIALLVLGGSLGLGGWRYAQNRGWVAGKPNSPRPENFKRALDSFLPRLVDPTKRPCATMGFHPGGPRTTGFPDTEFNWSPADYLARLEQSPRPFEFLPKRLELLAKHGYLQARPGNSDFPEYSLTWKGYATSNGAGCLYLAGVEHDVKLITFRKARVENGVDVYEVVAQPTLRSVEPWATDPDFAGAFDAQKFSALLEPAPVTYELARTKDGFAVLGEKGMRGYAVAHSAAVEAQPTEAVDPVRVRRATDEYLARGGGIRNPVCLSLPTQSGADETTHETTPMGASVPATITVYNLPERSGTELQATLASYELLRRMESLGFAKSELLAVGSFKRRIATGGVRFELTEKVRGLLWQSRMQCLLIGTAEVEEIVMVQRFSEAVPRPRFIARARLKLKDGMEPVVAKFRHLERMVDPGLVVLGILEHSEGQLKVASLSQATPQFHPDLSEVRLPVLEAPASPRTVERPAPPAPFASDTRGMRSPSPGPRSRLQPNTRVIRCGGDTIVCDSSDTVICRGRVIPCR